MNQQISWVLRISLTFVLVFLVTGLVQELRSSTTHVGHWVLEPWTLGWQPPEILLHVGIVGLLSIPIARSAWLFLLMVRERDWMGAAAALGVIGMIVLAALAGQLGASK